MTAYEILTTDNRIIAISAATPEDACERVADLHQTTVTAWRLPPTALLVGTDRIIG
jgi:hypothetical protein